MTVEEIMKIEDENERRKLMMAKMAEEGKLSPAVIEAVMQEEKPNQKERIVLRGERFASLFPKNLPISKREDVVLKGEDYESPVKLWMPFTYLGEGLHDADWRSEWEFGGTTYINSGSHGCVNLPPEYAKKIFENLDVWTPVLVCRASDAKESAQSGE